MPQRPWYRQRWVQALIAFQVLLLVAAAVPFFAFYNAVVRPDRPQPTWEGPLTADQRKAVFDALWTQVDRRYSYLEQKGVNWDARRSEYWEQAKAAPDDESFYRTLERMVASLNDGHTALIWYPGKREQTTPPVTLDWVEKMYVVVEVGPELEGKLRPGDRLVEIDGRRTEEAAQDLMPYIGHATEIGRRLSIARLLLAGEPGSQAVTLFARGDEYFSLTLERPPLQADAADTPRPASPVSAKRVGPFGYIRIESWRDGAVEGVDEALEQLRDTPGIILDVRGNGGGNDALAADVAGRFLTAPVPFSKIRFRMYPFWTPTILRTVQPRGPWTYTGPVALLIDGRVYSSNDFFVGGLACSGRVTTFGSPTAGGSGNPAVITLPGGAKLRLSRWIEHFPDGTPVEGNGTQPDVLVEPTIADIASGRDPVLEKAVEWLESVTR